MKNFILGLCVSLLIIFSALGGALADRLFVFKPLDQLFGSRTKNLTPTSTQIVRQESNSVVDIVSKTGSAVVTVNINGTRPDNVFFDWSTFGFKTQKGEEYKQDIGSGFIVDSQEGLIITNKHVVSNEGVEYNIITSDSKEYKVKKIYRDPNNDLAIIKIDPKDNGDVKLVSVSLGNSDDIKVGQSVIAIGTALGEFRNTVTTGIVSGLGRGIHATDFFAGVTEKIDNLIQTDAAINPGNSGGPLLDLNGKVVGINTAIAGNGQGVGFALPVNLIKEAIDNFNNGGKFDRPFLGIEYKEIPQQTAVMNDIPQGAFVSAVKPGSSAERAGIVVGDIIVRFAGEKISDTKNGLLDLIGKKKSGEIVQIEIYRNKEFKTISITLESQK